MFRIEGLGFRMSGLGLRVQRHLHYVLEVWGRAIVIVV